MATTTTFTPITPPSTSNITGTHHHSGPSLSFQTPLPSTTATTPPHLLSLLPTHHHHHRVRRLLRLAADHRDLALTRSLHAALTKEREHHDNTRALNSLLHAYVKIGLLFDARKLFDEMPLPDVASFTSIISYYAKAGFESEVAGLLNRMRLMGIDPNEVTFVAVITNCIRQSNLSLGFQIHALALKAYYIRCTFVSNALMGMYVRCGRIDYAFQLFDDMPERNVSSWNAVILGMVEEYRYADAFELFNEMSANGRYGDQFSLSTLLRAAVEGVAMGEGEAVHAYAHKIGLNLDLSVGNALLSFYTRFGKVEDLLYVFTRMPVKDVISWTEMLHGFMEFGLVESAVDLFNNMPERNQISYNALLAGFCSNGHGSKGLEFLQQILKDGVEISDFTLTSLVKACSLVSDPRKSKQIHGFVIKSRCQPGGWIDAALVDMCASCGRMGDARKIFDQQNPDERSSIVWMNLIHAYARNGQPEEALSLFHRIMKREDTSNIDVDALATILGVCGTLGFYNMGRQIKSIAFKLSVSSEVGVSNAIVSMLAKCGYLEDAVLFFNQMLEHDTISWNTLINAYLLFRMGDKALSLWNKMENSGTKPDAISFVLIISACKYTSTISVHTCEKLFHSMSCSQKIEPGPEHYAAMVDVLSSWECFNEAEKLIKNMPFKPDAAVWRALLDGCRLRSNHRCGLQVVQRLLALEPQHPSTYILVSNLYSASGRWHCAEKVREEMLAKGLQKNPARSWIINQNALHSFFCRDKSHPQYKDIHGALEILILECMKAGYEPDTSFVLHEVEEYQKRDFLFYHSAKLAATYGIIMSGQTQTVRVVKNVRLCGDCHMFLKFTSSVTCREIVVRDSTGFHSFKGGGCSCGDCW